MLPLNIADWAVLLIVVHLVWGQKFYWRPSPRPWRALPAAKRRHAASSVAPVASGYARSLRPCLACFSRVSASSRPRDGAPDGGVGALRFALRRVVVRDDRVGSVRSLG